MEWADALEVQVIRVPLQTDVTHFGVAELADKLAVDNGTSTTASPNRVVDQGVDPLIEQRGENIFTIGRTVNIRRPSDWDVEVLLEWAHKVGVCPPLLWGIGDVTVLWRAPPNLNGTERSNPNGRQFILVLVKPINALLDSFLWSCSWNVNRILNLVIDITDCTDELGPAGFNAS